MEREEIDAIWEKLRQHERAIEVVSSKNLKVARYSAQLMINSTYNSWITNFHVLIPNGLEGFAQYVQPRKEKAIKIVKATKNVKKIFETAREFDTLCIDYYESQRKS